MELAKPDSTPIDSAQIQAKIAEMVSAGCHFVVEGPVVQAIDELIDKLLQDGEPDQAGVDYLTALQVALRMTSVPVRPKRRPPGENKIEIVDKMPVLPKLPASVARNRRRRERP